MNRSLQFVFVTTVATAPASRAHAFVGAAWDYVQKYQIGIDYTNSYDGVNASYETSRVDPAAIDYPQDCVAVDDDPLKQRCDVHMMGGSSSGFGLFLQQAFKRQGFFYFTADIGFGVRYLNGAMSKEDATEAEADGLPIRKMSFSLAALVAKPYIQFGITPAATWPDILLSLGPAAQVAVGTVKVNDESESVALATSSGLFRGFYELELVLWRFGEGALSVFTSNDVTGNEEGTKFYPKDVDGMSDFRANFSRTVSGGVFGLGLKILLNFP